MPCRGKRKGFLVTLTGIAVASTALSAQASPEIAFVSSFYQTASGAIGPQQIIATQTYRIKLDGVDEIIIDRIIAGRRESVCEPVTLSGHNHIVDFSLSIAIQQKRGGGVSYIADIIIADDKVSSCTVKDLEGSSQLDVDPAMVIYGHDNHSSYDLTRDNFDQSTSQYNK